MKRLSWIFSIFTFVLLPYDSDHYRLGHIMLDFFWIVTDSLLNIFYATLNMLLYAHYKMNFFYNCLHKVHSEREFEWKLLHYVTPNIYLCQYLHCMRIEIRSVFFYVCCCIKGLFFVKILTVGLFRLFVTFCIICSKKCDCITQYSTLRKTCMWYLWC